MLALFLTEKLPSPPPPSSNKSSLPRNEAGQGLGPLPVPVGLPPVRVVLADHVENVPALEGDAELVTRDVEIIVRSVGEVCPVVELKYVLLCETFLLLCTGLSLDKVICLIANREMK